MSSQQLHKSTNPSWARRLPVTLAALAFAFTSLAQAATYGEVQQDQSKISFTFEQMGVKMDGQFKQFGAQLQFDPLEPSKASARFEVALASVDLGAPEFNQEVTKKDWFNIDAFPKATFESNSIKPVGDNRFEVSGTLSIKGQNQAITVPAVFRQEDGRGVFAGEFTIKRGQFSIGQGSWSKFDIVANDVVVRFEIAAKPN